MNQNNINYYSKEDLRNVLRQIGSQYTMWTRSLLVSKASSIDDQEVLENRLYEVVNDFVNLLLVYYDQNLLTKIEDISRRQITLMISLIHTLLYEDEAQSKDVILAVQNNSKDLAYALNELNPYLNESILTNSLHGLLSMTIDEILKRKSKQYALDVYQYRFIEYQIYMIADYIWEGFLSEFYT
ncbi:MAG: hypothetical protein ACK5JH_15080 [Anaerocolumna sp.]